MIDATPIAKIEPTPSVNRRVTYRLYPNVSQIALLEAIHDLHRGLYNAALQERISAWRNAKKSISFNDQCKSLTEIRTNHPEYRGLNAQSGQVTLKRLHKAYTAFFNRVKAKKTPGFPRFKSKKRFSGWGYKAHGDGFKFTPGKNWKHGVLKLSGVGDVRIRGETRTPGRIVSCDIMRIEHDHWEASIVISCDPYREHGELESGLDWGVESYATVGRDFDDFDTLPNERFFAAERDALKASQQAHAKRLRGKRSKSAEKARRQISKRHRKLSNRRKNRNHQASAKLIKTHTLIVTEKLNVKNMTRSAKGTVEAPGSNVAQKAGLTREILDTAPADLIKMITYKAEEAGCDLIVLNTKKAKPSQRDPLTLKVRKKTLAERKHVLPDGRVIGRDHAASLTMLRLGLNSLGREPAWVQLPETASIAA